jgi:hypothetical protein
VKDHLSLVIQTNNKSSSVLLLEIRHARTALVDRQEKT